MALTVPFALAADDPVAYSFVAMGCNRINGGDIRPDNPSTENPPQIERSFAEIARLEPEPSPLFFTGDLVFGLDRDVLGLEAPAPRGSSCKRGARHRAHHRARTSVGPRALCVHEPADHPGHVAGLQVGRARPCSTRSQTGSPARRRGAAGPATRRTTSESAISTW